MADTSNPRVTSSMDLAAILAEGVLLLQKHHDPRGSEVTDAMAIDRFGAGHLNFLEEWLIALQTNLDSLSAGAAEVVDTRTTGATTTGSITSGGGTGNFSITGLGSRTSVQWLRCTANAPSTGGRIQLYADSARTKLVYDADLKAGDPPVDVADYSDGLVWSAISSDGTGLADSTLYGTITNDGGSNSTYTVRLVAVIY